MRMAIKQKHNVFWSLQNEGRVQFLDELPKRLSSVSGGALKGESVKDTVDRELYEEMKGCFIGEGELTVLSDIPYFICYQEEHGKANLLAGVVAIYKVGAEEEKLFEEEGRFWKMNIVANRASPWREGRENRLVFRPAFQVAVGILQFLEDGVPRDEISDEISRL